MVELSDRRSAISEGLVERICAALGFLGCVRGLLGSTCCLFDRLPWYIKKDFLAVSELCFSISFGGALSWADLRRLFVTRARSVVLGFFSSVIHTSVPET